MQTVVTHSGSFDPDDVLAIASLQLYLGVENTKVIRSRNKEIIDSADWVVDVGGVYDAEKRRFDHHQNGVPKRENGIPYSAFGLIWKEFGVAICDSESLALHIERKLVYPIDAADNHIAISHPNKQDVIPFEFFDVIDAIKPVWGSEESFDSQFLQAVEFARGLLERKIMHGKARVAVSEKIKANYDSAVRKSILVFSESIPRHFFIEFQEVRVVVTPVPSPDSDCWMASVIPVSRYGFQNRAIFPESWGGLVDGDLEKESGVEGAVFCHKERYIFVAKTKESALKAAGHAFE
ncbi:MYG1 family protein [Candidatus Kaiserbacteria bacterium]|nr:MYG1 family protein [Candidatus Kaiserbacteria bacterium]USN92281.1 MAG: MYG1 family protein [Candidatus Nomurabacteria bacterium]